MSSSQNALKCFEENIRLFGNARTEPEKFNLYNGLANLATAIKDMQAEIDSLRQEVIRLRSAQ